jgi:hypothetical protein
MVGEAGEELPLEMVGTWDVGGAHRSIAFSMSLESNQDFIGEALGLVRLIPTPSELERFREY